MKKIYYISLVISLYLHSMDYNKSTLTLPSLTSSYIQPDQTIYEDVAHQLFTFFSKDIKKGYFAKFVANFMQQRYNDLKRYTNPKATALEKESIWFSLIPKEERAHLMSSECVLCNNPEFHFHNDKHYSTPKEHFKDAFIETLKIIVTHRMRRTLKIYIGNLYTYDQPYIAEMKQVTGPEHKIEIDKIDPDLRKLVNVETAGMFAYIFLNKYQKELYKMSK